MSFDPVTAGLSVVEAGLLLARVLVERGMLKINRKNLDSIRDIRLEIIDERAKGDAADQALISHKFRELGIYAQALATEIELAASKKD